MEKPKDRDLLETVEGLIFCVVGYLHPPNRYTAYLKYIPALEGKWRKDDTRYTRTLSYYHVTQMENTYNYLKENHPEYLFHCPVRDINISAVPKSRVRRYYYPRERLCTLLKMGPSDPLEETLTELVNHMVDNSSLKFEDVGVTGSLLTKTHNPSFSDIDLTVYGYDASISAKEFLTSIKEQNEIILPLNSSRKKEFITNRSRRFPVGKKDLELILSRRWNFGLYKDTYFSLHPTRIDAEITEAYGERRYRRKGVITGSASIISDKESLYLPSIYHVGQSDTVPEVEVMQIVSYESLFGGVFFEGEVIEFRGILEEVKSDQNYQRAVIGGAGYGEGFICLKR